VGGGSRLDHVHGAGVRDHLARSVVRPLGDRPLVHQPR
jgi:hypothetical protein